MRPRPGCMPIRSSGAPSFVGQGAARDGRRPHARAGPDLGRGLRLRTRPRQGPRQERGRDLHRHPDRRDKAGAGALQRRPGHVHLCRQPGPSSSSPRSRRIRPRPFPPGSRPACAVAPAPSAPSHPLPRSARAARSKPSRVTMMTTRRIRNRRRHLRDRAGGVGDASVPRRRGSSVWSGSRGRTELT